MRPRRAILRLRRACKLSAMSLSSEEVERYARQIVLRGVGGPGQNRLKAARALVVGAGGLGSPALQYLAARASGRWGSSTTTTWRCQTCIARVIHGTDDVGRPKTASATEAIRRLNPHVSVEPISLRLEVGERARARSAVRRRAGRLGQFRHPLCALRRLLLGAPAAGDGGARRVRRDADGPEALRDGSGRPAEPDLPLPLPRPARAGNDPDLRGSRRARRARRRPRLADGARGDPRRSSAASATATKASSVGC